MRELHGDEGGERREQGSGDGDGAPVFAKSLANEVGDGAATGGDGFTVEEAGEVFDERADARVSLGFRAGEGFEDDGFEVARKAGFGVAGRARLGVARDGEEFERRERFVEGPCAGRHAVEDDAECIDIGGDADFGDAPGSLLGGHEHRRAERLAIEGEGVAEARVVEETGEAEIENLRDAVFANEDVGGFKIAMDDAVVVRVLDAVADGEEEAERRVQREHFCKAELVQGKAMHEFHRVPRASLGDAARVDARDVRMLLERGSFDLALKSPEHVLAAREVTVRGDRREELHGDGAFRPALPRAPDGGEVAAGNQFDQLEVADRRRWLSGIWKVRKVAGHRFRAWFDWLIRKFSVCARIPRDRRRAAICVLDSRGASANNPGMKLTYQLSVFLENKPGTLAKVCEELARQKINIYALTISDTVDHAVIRMVVSDTAKTLALFEERGVLVVECKVLMIENANSPGALAKIAARLGKAKINIEYAYLATSPRAKSGLLVVRASDPKKALKVLSKK